MGKIILTINKADYTIACTDGEEDHVRQLGALLNDKVAIFARQFPHAEDSLLLIMAGLMILDEKKALMETSSLTPQDIEQLTRRLEKATHTIEALQHVVKNSP
ncbi:MAG: cell division protein ZapA [Alphaproteobacteria bacterium GM7ARS4]|nr:cell division protein ZapA [Alphaproteobacteria bacterium GM7ARS4]